MSKVIGLTGPIGAGKDEAAKILRRHGAIIIDADEVAHTLYGRQSPVWSHLVKTFGSKILRRGGKINRKKLGEIVFSDKKKLQELNRIIHPHLKDEIIKIIKNWRQETGDRRLIIINAAVLREIGLVDYVDEVWVVIASKENRLKRIVKSGLSKEEALGRMRSHAPQKDYLKIADVVIKNDKTIGQLRVKLTALLGCWSS